MKLLPMAGALLAVTALLAAPAVAAPDPGSVAVLRDLIARAPKAADNYIIEYSTTVKSQRVTPTGLIDVSGTQPGISSRTTIKTGPAVVTKFEQSGSVGHLVVGVGKGRTPVEAYVTSKADAAVIRMDGLMVSGKYPKSVVQAARKTAKRISGTTNPWVVVPVTATNECAIGIVYNTIVSPELRGLTPAQDGSLQYASSATSQSGNEGVSFTVTNPVYNTFLNGKPVNSVVRTYTISGPNMAYKLMAGGKPIAVGSITVGQTSLTIPTSAVDYTALGLPRLDPARCEK